MPTKKECQAELKQWENFVVSQGFKVTDSHPWVNTIAAIKKAMETANGKPAADTTETAAADTSL